MNCYKADAISRNNIRDFVHMLKKEVGLEHTLVKPGRITGVQSCRQLAGLSRIHMIYALGMLKLNQL